jgi:hypothetical protein
VVKTNCWNLERTSCVCSNSFSVFVNRRKKTKDAFSEAEHVSNVRHISQSKETYRHKVKDENIVVMWSSSGSVSCEIVLDQLLQSYMVFFWVVTANVVLQSLALLCARNVGNRYEGLEHGGIIIISSLLGLLILHPHCPDGCNCAHDGIFSLVSNVIPWAYFVFGVVWYCLLPPPKAQDSSMQPKRQVRQKRKSPSRVGSTSPKNQSTYPDDEDLDGDEGVAGDGSPNDFIPKSEVV